MVHRPINTDLEGGSESELQARFEDVNLSCCLISPPAPGIMLKDPAQSMFAECWKVG